MAAASAPIDQSHRFIIQAAILGRHSARPLDAGARKTTLPVSSLPFDEVNLRHDEMGEPPISRKAQ